MNTNQNPIQIWLLFVVLLALPASVKAQFTFTTNDGTITITGYTGIGGAVTFPTNINGLIVTAIGDGQATVFPTNNVTSVTIPGSVMSIGAFAFDFCSSLTNVTIDNGVTSIGLAAFEYCYGLTALTIPASVTNIVPGPFEGCYGLSTLTVDSGNLFYSSVGGVLFDENQTTLVAYPAARAGPSYSIPVSVTRVADYAFDGSDIRNITFPDTLTGIGNSSFNDCSILNGVTIPASVTNIGEAPFGLCTELTAITVNSNNPAYISVAGVLFNKNLTTLIQYPVGSGATSYTVPNGVTDIEQFAFAYSILTNVTLPASLTSIEILAFVSCSGLTGVYFQGNSPSPISDSSVFEGDNQATVYYFSGTSGWGSTFDGRPTVKLNPPNAFTITFTGNPTNGIAPLSVQFGSPSVDSGGNAITNWNWTFGDGSTGSTQNPSHIYNYAGVFQPGFVGTDSLGFAVYGSGPEINVSAPPLTVAIQPTNNPLFVTAGNNVTFSVSVAGAGPFSYQWQFNGTNLPDEIITTVAGKGTYGYSGDGGTATNAELTYPSGLAVDPTGNLFIADYYNFRIRNVGTDGIISTVAGDGTQGYSGDGGAATNAELGNANGLALDGTGNLFIADTSNQRIRKLGTNGIITTVAGNGTQGYSGDGGAATNARLYNPYDVLVDATGNLFIADTSNQRIRRVGANGIITTVAGNGTLSYSGDGGAATNAELWGPGGVSVDATGNLFIAELYNDRIRKVGANGIITTVVGNGSFGYSGDGGPAFSAELYYPRSVLVDTTGNLFIADSYNNRIRGVATNGIVITVAGNGVGGYSGDGAAATNAELNSPESVKMDATGNLFIADSVNSRIRKVANAGVVALGPTLVLNHVAVGDAGAYDVVVSNPYGSVTDSVNVAVSPAPIFTPGLTTFHSFSSSGGAYPSGGLTALGDTLFGTTTGGGASGSDSGAVFTLNTDGTGFRAVHNFIGADGADITSDLSLAGGTLYGATSSGGLDSQGTLFSVMADGSSFTNIYFLDGLTSGANPKGGVLLSGNTLYGTTSAGAGARSDGVVFAVKTNGANFTTLHIFDGADGEEPQGDLVRGGNALYGTTRSGGASFGGTIFSVQTNGSNFVSLHSFTGADGDDIVAGLVLSGGILYGTAELGGSYDYGTVFSIDTNGSGFTVLHSFNAANNDGSFPAAALFLSGNVLYGTTSEGGTFNRGTLFSINTDGSGYTQLYSFGENGTNDGANPQAPVILVGNTLYGTTESGGSDGFGTVFGFQLSGVIFTLEPVGATNVPIGSNVVFTATGESLSFPGVPLQYQWRLNGVNIPGATTTELIFQDVQATNGGTVTVTISDGINAATSVPVGFSVAIPILASANDNFVNAFPLGAAGSGVVASSNTNATREPGEPEILPGDPGGKSIWFQWQPTASGTAVFATRGSGFDTIMGVYTGTSVTALTRVPSCVNDDDAGGDLTSEISFTCSAGTTYDVVVDGHRGASGSVVLSWVTTNFAAPLPSILQTPPQQTITSNSAAVTLVCVPSAGVLSWFFNGQPTGVTGPDFLISAVGDTNVGTYVAEVSQGGAVASIEPVHVQINLLEDGTSDPNSIAWNKFLDSANSPYSNPTQSSFHKSGGPDTRGYSVAQTFSTLGAVAELGDPSIDGQIGGSPNWYTYVTPTNGALLINTAGSSFNTLLGVYVGPGDSFATLTNIGAAYTTNRVRNGQPQIYIPNVPQGQTNFIVVDGYKGASGTVQLNIFLGDPVVIATPPQSQFVPAGSNVSFTVAADGSTPLSYQWQFDGTNITGATNGSLTVSNVQAANFGTYTIVVSNLVSVISNSATLSLFNGLTLNAPSFKGGVFEIELDGAPAGSYVLQTSTNLLNWIPLTTNTALSGLVLLMDTNAGSFNFRLYRVVTE